MRGRGGGRVIKVLGIKNWGPVITKNSKGGSLNASPTHRLKGQIFGTLIGNFAVSSSWDG